MQRIFKTEGTVWTKKGMKMMKQTCGDKYIYIYSGKELYSAHKKKGLGKILNKCGKVSYGQW